MGKLLEDQSPWISPETNLINDSLLNGIGDSLPNSPGSMQKSDIPKTGNKPWETGGFSKNSMLMQLLRLLIFLAIIAFILFLMLNSLSEGKSASDDNFRGIIKKSDISKIDSDDYKLTEIDEEYYEINTSSKDVINNPAVEKDAFFELKNTPAATQDPDCRGKEDWDKKILGSDRFVEDHIRKNQKRLTVAIIDTGIDKGSVKLKKSIDSKNSINIADPKETIQDKNGHGTSVSAIINRYVPSANLIIIKATRGDSKKVSSIDTIKSINYAIKKKPDVINISFGGEINKNEALQKTISKANSMGIVIVVSDSDSSKDKIKHFPAGYTGLISVGSFNDKMQISSFSDTSSSLKFPGECILGVDGFERGSSFSTPIVTSFIILMKMYSIRGDGADFYIGKIRSSSSETNGIPVSNLPKLLDIADKAQEYSKNIDGIKKDLNKSDISLEKFKSETKNATTLESHEKAFALLRAKNLKIKNDIRNKLNRIKDIYKKSGIVFDGNSTLMIEVNKDLTAISDFFVGDKVILDVTKEKKLKKTLGVDSCIENSKNLICGKQKGSISEKCTNKFVGGKNLVCGINVPIINSGAQLPAAGVGKYVTILNNQEILPIIVIEGDKKVSKDNKQIGKVILESLPKKNAGQAGGNVTFNVDTNGTLSVKVVDLNNKNNEVLSRIENLESTEDVFQVNGLTPKKSKKIESLQQLLRISIIRIN